MRSNPLSNNAQLFGFSLVAYRGMETGYRKTASYWLEQGDIRLRFSSALSPDHPISQSVLKHGDGVGVIAFLVADAKQAYRDMTGRGARGRHSSHGN